MSNRKVIEWTVLLADGSEVRVYAATKVGAFMEAQDRGYKPVSPDDIYETPE